MAQLYKWDEKQVSVEIKKWLRKNAWLASIEPFAELYVSSSVFNSPIWAMPLGAPRIDETILGALMRTSWNNLKYVVWKCKR